MITEETDRPSCRGAKEASPCHQSWRRTCHWQLEIRDRQPETLRVNSRGNGGARVYSLRCYYITACRVRLINYPSSTSVFEAKVPGDIPHSWKREIAYNGAILRVIVWPVLGKRNWLPYYSETGG